MIWEISWPVAEVAKLWIIILEARIFHMAQRSSFLIKVQTYEWGIEDHWTFVQKTAMINMITFLTGWIIGFIETLGPASLWLVV